MDIFYSIFRTLIFGTVLQSGRISDIYIYKIYNKCITHFNASNQQARLAFNAKNLSKVCLRSYSYTYLRDVSDYHCLLDAQITIVQWCTDSNIYTLLLHSLTLSAWEYNGRDTAQHKFKG